MQDTRGPSCPDMGAGLGLRSCGFETQRKLPTVFPTLGEVLPLSGIQFRLPSGATSPNTHYTQMEKHLTPSTEESRIAETFMKLEAVGSPFLFCLCMPSKFSTMAVDTFELGVTEGHELELTKRPSQGSLMPYLSGFCPTNLGGRQWGAHFSAAQTEFPEQPKASRHRPRAAGHGADAGSALRVPPCDGTRAGEKPSHQSHTPGTCF